MGLYESCPTCNGSGSLPCEECKCSNCKATGKVDAKCTACQSGKVRCDTCSGAGRLLEKKGWFSDKYKACYACSGSGMTPCRNCYGAPFVKIACSTCGGSGRNPRCSRCGTKRTLTCTTCGGAGKFEGEWIKSLRALPVDRLTFEHDRRQREVADLRRQISECKRAFDQVQRDQSEAYREAEQSGPRGIHDFYAGGYEKEANALGREIRESEARADELRAEMSAIKNVLDKKWK